MAEPEISPQEKGKTKHREWISENWIYIDEMNTPDHTGPNVNSLCNVKYSSWHETSVFAETGELWQIYSACLTIRGSIDMYMFFWNVIILLWFYTKSH